MAISHDGYDFENQHHGDIRPTSPPRLQLVVAEFAGLDGESHLVGGLTGRELTCRYLMDGYASRTALKTATDAIHAQTGQLTGTITITGNLARTIPKCTFLGFVHEEGRYDGSGVNGWFVRGLLIWRQRQIS